MTHYGRLQLRWLGYLVKTRGDEIDNETRRLGSAIDAKFMGRRIDDYLAEFFPFFSRSGWQREIERAVVLVNGIPARKPAQRLQWGDELCRIHPLSEEPEVDTHIPVLWNDGDLAMVMKPAGLPMHESGRYRRRTVVAVLRNILGPTWTHAHRLDRETSGLLLCARSPELRAKLVDIWMLRGVSKTYLAVLSGTTPSDEWTVNLPIKADRFDFSHRAHISDEGDEAVTEFRVLARGENATLVEAKPVTGRTNQIRVHAAAIGFPLIGDKVYGPNDEVHDLYRKEGNTEQVQEMAGFSRHALHAWKMAFAHPVSGAWRTWTCDLPDDLKALCRSRGMPSF